MPPETPGPTLSAIQGREAAATPAKKLTLIRYEHGGGRLCVDKYEDRELVADFYSEDNREFYYHARTDIPFLLAEVTRLTSALATAREEAVEESIRAVCPECRDGEFHHVTKGGQHANGFVCLGNPIRALRRTT